MKHSITKDIPELYPSWFEFYICIVFLFHTRYVKQPQKVFFPFQCSFFLIMMVKYFFNQLEDNYLQYCSGFCHTLTFCLLVDQLVGWLHQAEMLNKNPLLTRQNNSVLSNSGANMYCRVNLISSLQRQVPRLLLLSILLTPLFIQINAVQEKRELYM